MMKQFMKKRGGVQTSSLLWCALVVVLMAALPVVQVRADQATDQKVQKQLDEFDTYAAAGQGAAAMLAYQNAKREFPDHPQVRAYEAKILTMQNKMLEAVPVLEANLKDNPNHPLATALLASIEYRMGKQAEATARIEAALKVHPKAWEILQLAGELKKAQNDGDAAIQYWRPIIDDESNPEGARLQAFASIGQVALATGKFDLAASSFEQGLAIKWHPAVGMAYIQALDQAKQYGKVIDAIADMRKHLAAGNNPQLVQLRQQFETQIVPFEARAKENSVTSDIEKLLAGLAEGKITYLDANSRIASLTNVVAKLTDPKEKAALEKQLQLAKLEAQVVLLKDGLERKYTLDWQKERVGNIENLAKGLTGPRVDAAIALGEEVKANVAKLALSQTDSVLDLAKAGWTIAQFRYPSGDQLKELKERGLPERYDRFSTELKQALKEYYAPLAAKRENLELEKATAAFIQTPGDKALKAKVARLLTDRVKTIDVSKEDASTFDVIPAVIWTGPNDYNRSLNVDDKTYDRMELSYSIMSRLGTYQLSQNQRNEALIKAYTRPLLVYPREGTLRDRGAVYLYMGRYQEAWEDMAAAVAVSAWEEANSQKAVPAKTVTWGFQGIPLVVVLDQLATGKVRKDGLYPAAVVQSMLQAMQKKNWPALAELLMENHENDPAAIRIVRDITYGRNREQVLDAMVAMYTKAGDEEQKKKILAKIDQLNSYAHSGVLQLKAELEKEPAQKLSLLERSVMNEPRSVKASYELGKQFEAAKRLDDAILAYNIAAGGKLLTQTSGMAKEAAVARDRLSGPMANINDVLKIYQPHMENLETLINKGNANKLQASEQEALLLLMLNYGGNQKALYGRIADARRAMGDYDGANEYLAKYAQIMPQRKGIASALTGRNYFDSGRYPEALASFKQTVTQGYDESWVYYYIAQLEAFDGKYKEAVASYTKALEKKEDYMQALVERSSLYEYFFDESDKAIADLEKAIEISKKEFPNASRVTMELRLNNLKMQAARKQLGM